MAVGGNDALAALSMDMVRAALPDASPLLSASAVLPAACKGAEAVSCQAACHGQLLEQTQHGQKEKSTPVGVGYWEALNRPVASRPLKGV